jgi:concentrative nucleoside transporter, CNT family
MSAVQVDDGQQNIIERKQSASDSSVLKNTTADGVEKGMPQEDVEETKVHSWVSYKRLRPFILVGLALLILGWWISSIVLPATRHRWFVFQISNLRSLHDLLSPPGSYRHFGLGPLFCE